MSARRDAATRPQVTTSAAHVGRALLIIATLSIMLMALGASVISYRFLHEQTARQVQTLAAFAASESRAALQFRDSELGREILQSIPPDEGITLAELRDASNFVLARAPEAKDGVFSKLATWLGMVHVSQDVFVDGKLLGRVVLEGGSEPLLRNLAGLLVWFALGMLVIAFSALYIARRYTRRITQPIHELRTVVERLIEHRDFSQRAPPSSLTELEELRLEFNILLEEIGVRDHLLTETNAALRRVAYVDTLTGLPNRAMFEQSLVRIIDGCARAKVRAALFYLDIDAFKSVNDTFGHAAGDALLGEIGSRLRAWHSEETVAARIGGDEFVVLISPLNSTDNVAQIAAALQHALDEPVGLGGRQVHAGISIGAATYPDMTDDPDELIRLADQAMYIAKDTRYRLGKVTRWNSDMPSQGRRGL